MSFNDVAGIGGPTAERTEINTDVEGFDVTLVSQNREITPTFTYSLSRVETYAVDFLPELHNSSATMGKRTQHILDNNAPEEYVLLKCYDDKVSSCVTQFDVGERIHLDADDEYDGLYEIYDVDQPDYVERVVGVNFVDNAGEEQRHLKHFTAKLVPVE